MCILHQKQALVGEARGGARSSSNGGGSRDAATKSSAPAEIPEVIT
jgi:hypothetical protein